MCGNPSKFYTITKGCKSCTTDWPHVLPANSWIKSPTWANAVWRICAQYVESMCVWAIQSLISFCAYLQITSLDLSGNTLTTIPESMRTLTMLKELVLAGNRFADLSPLQTTIACWCSLNRLDASGNRLYALPDDMRALEYLEHLDLSTNMFEVLPPGGELSESWAHDFEFDLTYVNHSMFMSGTENA